MLRNTVAGYEREQAETAERHKDTVATLTLTVDDLIQTLATKTTADEAILRAAVEAFTGIIEIAQRDADRRVPPEGHDYPSEHARAEHETMLATIQAARDAQRWAEDALR